MRLSRAAVGAVGAMNLLGVAAVIPACVVSALFDLDRRSLSTSNSRSKNTCTNQVRDSFETFSCTSATDAACLCKAQNFNYGIISCSSATCGATEAEVQSFLGANFCKGEAGSHPEQTTITLVIKRLI